jgi:hypothetical protein
MRKVRFGVLGVAKIATEKVIPGIQRGERCEVVAIASRVEAKAARAAAALGLTKAYGSYEALLADPRIDAVYIPLPNHLHVVWSIAAAEQGKHVLCEKAIALSAGEAEELIAARDRTRVKMQEAFMVWTHPQWIPDVRPVHDSGRPIREGDPGRHRGAVSAGGEPAEHAADRVGGAVGGARWVGGPVTATFARSLPGGRTCCPR